MKRLKHILSSSKYLYLIIFVITISFAFLYTKCYPFKSKYKINEEEFHLKINTYQIEGDKLTITGLGKEKIIINYYFKSKEEKESFPKKYHLNDLIKVTGNLEKPTKNTIPNTFNYQKYLYHNYIYYLLNASDIKIMKKNTSILYYLKDALLNRLNSLESRSYLKTFILGDKRDLSNEMTDNYNNNGIIHLFSISGMHISLFTAFIFLITKKLSYNYRYPYYVTIIFLISYILFIGISPSILRSIIMYLLFTINKIYQIKIKKINIFLLGLSIILMIKPFYLYSIGFQLSFLISSAIILLNKRINHYSGHLKKLLIIAIISFLISFPLVLYNSYQVNYLSVIINIIFIPYVTYIVFPLSILTIIIPLIEPIFLFFINLLETLTLMISSINTTIIFMKPTILYIYLYYLILFLVIYYHQFILFIILIILIAFLKIKPLLNSNYFVTFLDVNQGDSFLINYPHQQGTILIDTGGVITYPKESWQEREKYSLVKNKTILYLKSLGITKINYLILTHGDYDHMGEAINLVNNFSVDKVIFNCGTYNELEMDLIELLKKQKIKYYSCPKTININQYQLQFLNNQDYHEENDNSLVIYTKIEDHQFLFMGDAGINVESDLLKKYQINNLDILKVGHHGSNTSSSTKFIDTINPKYSLISVGKNNRYGHPSQQVLETLKKTQIYRTDQEGSVVFNIKKKKLKIETYKG